MSMTFFALGMERLLMDTIVIMGKLGPCVKKVMNFIFLFLS